MAVVPVGATPGEGPATLPLPGGAVAAPRYVAVIEME
jgi:hypothetical protein